jgi:hypothetical protein
MIGLLASCFLVLSAIVAFVLLQVSGVHGRAEQRAIAVGAFLLVCVLAFALEAWRSRND